MRKLLMITIFFTFVFVSVFCTKLYAQTDSCCVGIRGNVDGDIENLIDISDLVFLVANVFGRGEAPSCRSEAILDGHEVRIGGIKIGPEIDDVVYLVDFMFRGGPAPALCFSSECSVIDSIIVTTTPELTFSWEPKCALTACLIEPSGSGSDQWFVLYEGSNSILPPITYGVVPTGATERHAPEILIPGSTYRLILFKWIGPGGDDGILLDTISFTM